MRAILSKRSGGGALLTLWARYRICTFQLARTAEAGPAVEQIDAAGVRSDLLSLAQAERYYLAVHGTYASLEQLRKSAVVSTVPQGARRGYSYAVVTDGSRHFVITARPHESRSDLPVLSVDETMTIRP